MKMVECKPCTPQGEIGSKVHLKATMLTQVIEAKVGTNANGATINQGFMMASTNYLKYI